EDEEDEDRRARRIHHERLSPRDNAVEIPVEEIAAYDTGGHQKQNIAARREVEPVNIAQEITAPKAENGHHRAVNDKVEGEEILKLPVADDLDNAAEGVAEGLGRAVVKGVAGRRIANDEAAEDQRAKADDRGNPEDGAPSDHIGKQRRWRRREKVADTAHRDDKREVEGETLRRQPARDDDERAHQNRRAARANDKAGADQFKKGGRKREADRTDIGEQHQYKDRLSWPVAVEESPDGHLHQGKGDEEAAADEPELLRRQSQLIHHVRPNNGNGRAEEVACHIDGRQGQNNSDRVRRFSRHREGHS